MTKQARSFQEAEPAVSCSHQLGMLYRSPRCTLLNSGSPWSLLLLLAWPRALHSHGSCSTLHGISAPTSSSLSWQGCFAILGGANREEDPNKELYRTWECLGNCARGGSESFQLTVSLKSSHVLGLVLAMGCTM